MEYIQVILTVDPAETGREILIALLGEIGFESFEETDSGLLAYIPSTEFQPESLEQLINAISDEFIVSYSCQNIQEENWNAKWESEYEPVFIGDQIYIRAPFHPLRDEFPFQLLIEPKMSFGTAHHETTAMMLELLLETDVQNKSVLDMGCGTGVLAILACKKSAGKVLGIDNESWAYENALENVQKNNCNNISVLHGGVEKITDDFDVILANINKNVLMNDMAQYVRHLSDNGVLMLSGFYDFDLDDIRQKVFQLGLEEIKVLQKNKWQAAAFRKLN